MAKYQSADELLERIAALKSGYHERSFFFVLAALEFGQQNRIERGHITGQELAAACRDFALEQFGLTARMVLEFWGLKTTADFGRIVFALIDLGLLMKQESDTLADFESVYDFEEAFDGSYPWQGLRPARQQQ